MGTRTELARSPVFEPDGTGGYTVRSARQGDRPIRHLVGRRSSFAVVAPQGAKRQGPKAAARPRERRPAPARPQSRRGASRRAPPSSSEPEPDPPLGQATASAVACASALLRRRLAAGPADVRELRALARETGVSWRSVVRARACLPITSTRVGGLGAEGRWRWSLTKAGAADAPKDANGNGAAIALTPELRRWLRSKINQEARKRLALLERREAELRREARQLERAA